MIEPHLGDSMYRDARKLISRFALLAAMSIAALPGHVQARQASMVEWFEIIEDGPAFEGRSFGEVGAYRLVKARAHVVVDIEHSANENIVDLQHASRSADGLVRYTADVEIITPQDPDKGRRVLLAEIPNRGMRIMRGIFDSGGDYPEVTPSFPSLEESQGGGTGFLEQRGYTIVWVGWQGDVSRIGAAFPHVVEDGKPAEGPVWITRVFDTEGPEYEWDLVYPAVSSDGISVFVRATQDEPAYRLPANAWELKSPSSIRIRRPAGFGPSAIYELSYIATGARVTGLGLASTRDVISFLVREEADRRGNPNPLAALRGRPCNAVGKQLCEQRRDENFDLALATGGSQSGRYLRDFLWQGFNDSGDGSRVFDGIIPFLSGSRTTFTNRRWAEPGRFSRQHEERTVYGDQFPFTYSTLTDPVSGETDGLMRRCRSSQTCPLVFQIDTSSEFWSAGASLIGTDPLGEQDLEFPEDVRAYLISSGTHQTRLGAPYASFAANYLASGPALRALLVAMEEWAGKGGEPPASRWPQLAKGQLAAPELQEEVGFPNLSGIGLTYTGNAYQLAFVDYSSAIPVEHVQRPYRVLVPTVDEDGNDIAGLRLPFVEVPLGTHLGWNPRKAGYAAGQIALLAGSFIPFAPDRQARILAGDPRLSVAERYNSSEDYVRQVGTAGATLVNERLLLPEDAADIQAQAGQIPFVSQSE